jgi:hypothetical protein
LGGGDHAATDTVEPGAKVSLEELLSLRRIANGVRPEAIPLAHRRRFADLGWIESQIGGLALTNTGRYQIEVRMKETGLPPLVRRWRSRAEELATIADSMTTGEAETLRALAAQWERLAAQVEELHRLELAEPLLT